MTVLYIIIIMLVCIIILQTSHIHKLEREVEILLFGLDGEDPYD